MKTLTIFLLIASACLQSFALDLPKAPENYKWVKILNNESALLLPRGWFFKEDHPKGTDAYFITKENIKKHGKFDTGLSLNVIYNIDKKSGASPTQYAKSWIHYAKKDSSKEVLKSSSVERGLFTTHLCKILDHKPGEDDVIIHYYLIANDQTGTLWMYFFEAPSKEWDKAWETGSVLLKHIVVESEL